MKRIANFFNLVHKLENDMHNIINTINIKNCLKYKSKNKNIFKIIIIIQDYSYFLGEFSTYFFQNFESFSGISKNECIAYIKAKYACIICLRKLIFIYTFIYNNWYFSYDKKCKDKLVFLIPFKAFEGILSKAFDRNYYK